jgi:Carboxypeptidase regulatory-like domain
MKQRSDASSQRTECSTGALRTQAPGRVATIAQARRLSLLWMLMAFVGASLISPVQGIGQASRVVQGRVIDAQEKPQADAVVYLQNQKSLEVRTYITTEDGSYRFGQLGSDVDYQLWAKFQNSKSKTRSISSFDSKKQFNFDLKLEPSK